MIQGAIWTLSSWEWGAWKYFKPGNDRVKFAFQKEPSGVYKGVDLESANLKARDQ